ncbi:MAG: DUF429 domain-containing protein [Lysobacterales bacterium]
MPGRKTPTTESVRLIGLDAASQRSKFGYALGHLSADGACVRVEEAGLLDDGANVIEATIAPFIAGGERVLVAIDAPLGWPDGLRQLLLGHAAGLPPPAGLSKDRCFRRLTDRAVRKVKIPLEIGADRIARAAMEALIVLQELRAATELPLPLAWSPAFQGAATIEVYPGATLVVHRLGGCSYKKTNESGARAQILQTLVSAGLLGSLPDAVQRRTAREADVLDAILCLVAARDFLQGKCSAPAPADRDQAAREGWIWLRQPGSADD